MAHDAHSHAAHERNIFIFTSTSGVNDLWTLMGVNISFMAYGTGFAQSEVAGDITTTLLGRSKMELLMLLWDPLFLAPTVYLAQRNMTKYLY
jgi:hypothetical protein